MVDEQISSLDANLRTADSDGLSLFTLDLKVGSVQVVYLFFRRGIYFNRAVTTAELWSEVPMPRLQVSEMYGTDECFGTRYPRPTLVGGRLSTAQKMDVKKRLCYSLPRETVPVAGLSEGNGILDVARVHVKGH